MSGDPAHAAAVSDGPGQGRCCGSGRLTMSDYIDRGLRRSRRPMLPVVGAVRADDEGRFARFSLRVEGEMIVDVRFQASPCVTLVAYCELAADLATGQTLAGAASRVRPVDLAETLPQVPAAKRARALLASQSLTAAIVTAVVPGIVPSNHPSFDPSSVRAAAVARVDAAEGAHT